MEPGSVICVSGILNCSVSQGLIPICCRCARSALVGLNVACSRKRPALRLGVPSPGPGLGGPTMLAVAVALEDGLATLVARMVTLAGLGAAAGAVNKPAGEMVPTAAEPPAIPLTLHVTLWFEEFATEAVKNCVAEGAIVTLA